MRMNDAARDPALEALRARIERFNRLADPAVVLAPDAVAEATQLMRRLGDEIRAPRGRSRPVDPGLLPTVAVIAWLHWWRARTDPSQRRDHEFRMAALLFGLSAGTSAQHAPPEITAWLEGEMTAWLESMNAGTGDLGFWTAKANGLATYAERVGDAEALELAIFILRWMLFTSPDDNPIRGQCLAALGEALRSRGDAFGDIHSYDEAIEVSRQAAAITDDAYPARAEILGILGDTLLARFEASGGDATLQEAIEVLRAAVRCGTPGQGSYATLQSRLGDGLRQRFVRTRDPAMLDEAVEVCREALRDSSAEGPGRTLVVMRFANSLLLRHAVGHRPADVEELVGVLKQECAATPPSNPYRSLALLLLAQALSRRMAGVRTSRTEDEPPASEADDESIDLMREAVATASAGHPLYPLILMNLASLLRERFERYRRDADLDEATEVGRRAVAAAPPGHPYRAGSLVVLARALAERLTGGSTQAEPDLRASPGEEGVQLLLEALTLLPTGDPTRLMAASTLADLVTLDARRTRDSSVLDVAITALGSELSALPTASPAYPAEVGRLSLALLARFECSGDTDYLAAAVQASAQAVASAPPDHPQRGEIRFGAALMRMKSFESTGDAAGLDEAVATLRDVAAVLGPSAITRPPALSTLALALRYRFEHSGDDADLEESERTARTAAEISDKTDILSNLGVVLHAVYERSRNDAALAEAIAVLRRAVDQAAQEGTGAAVARANLGDALISDYTWAGDPDLLNEAIRQLRQAVAEYSASDARRTDLLSNLGSALTARFERVGDTADLTEAVGACRTALSGAPPGHHRRGIYSANLGTALWSAFRRAGPVRWRVAPSRDELAELDEIIALLRSGVGTMAPGHMRRCTYLGNLATALLARHEHSPNPALVQQAVALLREAVTTTPADHAYLPTHRAGLGYALQVQYRLDGDPGHLDEALRELRTAVAGLPEGSHHLALALHNLGGTLDLALSAADGTDAMGLEAEAMAAFQRAAAMRTAPAHIRVRAATWWGQLAAARARWPEAFEAYRQAVALLPRIAGRELQRHDQELGLLSLSSLAGDAAACALHCADPRRALEVLEHGRGVLLARALESRTDLTELREQHPELARRLEQLRVALDDNPAAAATPSGAIMPPASTVGPDANRRHEAARDWDELVAHIRTMPGFGQFLASPLLEDLRAAARSGPVVVLNTSSYRCDAIVLTADDLKVVPLPNLTTQDLVPRAIRFLHALESAHGRPDAEERVAAGSYLRDTLRWLWRVVAEPVLTVLDIPTHTPSGTPPPRLWWCPTGLLSLLPVHAAGEPGDTGASVLDRVVPSNTPTLRALARAHTGLEPEPGLPRLLVVALPQTPGQADLPEVDAEAHELADRHPSARLLRGTDATPGKVVAALKDHPFAHFACHARGDPLTLSESFLQLHGGRLTVLGISRLQLARAELAFLSACSTAASSVALPDEAIHIASAFQLAGYQHVIATLWSVRDDIAAAVAGDFYSGLGAGTGELDSRDAALALHAAVQRQRAKYPYTPSLWAAHIHVGP